MKYLYLFLVALGFAAFIVVWLRTIKNQVMKHRPYKMKRRPQFTNHTPSGGVSRVQIGG